jgi:hypothetical protein
MIRKISILFLALLLVPLAGCPGYSSTGGPGKNISPALRTTSADASRLKGVNRVLIAPVEIDRDVSRKSDVRLSETHPFYADLVRAAEQGLQVEIVKGLPVLEAVGKQTGAGNSLDRNAALARSFSADSVIITRIHRYEERLGNRFAADRPASLSFTMRLIDSSEGRELWSASYRFHDEALSENFFKIKEKAARGKGKRGWQNAYQLLQSAFIEAVTALGSLREQQFAHQ